MDLKDSRRGLMQTLYRCFPEGNEETTTAPSQVILCPNRIRINFLRNTCRFTDLLDVAK